MWVRAIELQRWRTFREPIRVEGLAPGINLVVGPNETGKSTLVEALARLLFDRPKTTSAARLRPWGSDLAPEGALEFEAAGQQYRIEKRFHPTSGHALLKAERGGLWSDLREDDAVQDFVHELIGGQKIARGLSEPEQWGLFRFLWALQDSSLVPGELDDEIQGRIGARMPQEAVAGRAQGLLREVERRYLGWFTEKSGRESKKSPLLALREEVRKLEEGIVLLQENLQRTRELSARVKEELEREKEFAERIEAQKAEVTRLERESRAYEDLRYQRSEAEALQRAAVDAELGHRKLLADLKELTLQERHLRQLLGEGLAEREGLAVQAELGRQANEAAEAVAHEARSALDQARQARREASDRLTRLKSLLERASELEAIRQREAAARGKAEAAEQAGARTSREELGCLEALQRAEAAKEAASGSLEAARRTLEDSKRGEERRQLVERLRRVDELEARLAELAAELARIQAPAEEELRRLERLDAEILKVQTIIQAERFVVEFTPEKPIQARSRLDAGPLVSEELPGRAAVRYEGVQLSLILPGVGTLLVGRPGAGRQAAERLAELQKQKAELLARYAITPSPSPAGEGSSPQTPITGSSFAAPCESEGDSPLTGAGGARSGRGSAPSTPPGPAALDPRICESLPDLASLRERTARARELEREMEHRREELRGYPSRPLLEERLRSSQEAGPDPAFAAQLEGAALAEEHRRKEELALARSAHEAARKSAAKSAAALQSASNAWIELKARGEMAAEQLTRELASLGFSQTGRPGLEHAIATASAELSAAEAHEREAERLAKARQLELEQARRQLAELEKKKSGAESRQTQNELTLRDLQKTRLRLLEGTSEAELEARALSLEASSTRARSAFAALPALPAADPRLELETLKRELGQAMHDWEERLLKRSSLERELEGLSDQGIWERLAESRERLVIRKKDLDSESLKAAATQHLKELLEAAQDEARRKLGGPIHDWVASRAREVLGEAFGDVLFNDGLRLQQVARQIPAEAGGLAVDLGEFSRGTRDLLGLLVRLGMAELISARERQLVVLDDVLVHADDSRRRRVLKLLQEVAERVQILICTCHRDHYHGLGEGVRRIDLEALKARRG